MTMPKGRKVARQSAMTHGANARHPSFMRERSRKVRYHMNRIKAACFWISHYDDGPLNGYCRLGILLAQLGDHIDERGVVGEGAASQHAVETYRQLLSTQLRYAVQLGLTPRSRSELGLTVAQTRQVDAALDMADWRSAAPGATPVVDSVGAGG